MTGGALGFALTRYAFAVMIKFSGLTQALMSLTKMLDLEEEAQMIPQETSSQEQAIREILIEDVHSAQFIKHWGNASKMRTWLSQEKNRIGVAVEAEIPLNVM